MTRRGLAAELRRHGTSDLEIAAAVGWQRRDQVRRYATSAAIWADPPAAGLGLCFSAGWIDSSEWSSCSCYPRERMFG